MLGVASKLCRLAHGAARELTNVSSSTMRAPVAASASAMPNFESWRRHESNKPTIAKKDDALKQQLLTWGEYCAEVRKHFGTSVACLVSTAYCWILILINVCNNVIGVLNSKVLDPKIGCACFLSGVAKIRAESSAPISQ